ncbi:MAG: MFS transporter [Treponema sp.]|jgi:MFS family permease|nr:MFS transporter [Treponema sp.]
MEHKTTSIWNKVYTCTFIASFLMGCSQSMVNPLIASYTKLLGADEVTIGVLSGLYFGVAFMARPFSGPVVAMLNKKYIMLFAYSLGFIVNVGYAISGSIPVFMVSRILHGLQLAFIGSLTLTLASASLPPEKIGSGIGLFGAAGATANAIAPSVGIALRSLGEQSFGSVKLGYTVIFLVASVCMLISIIPCVLMPYKHPSKAEIARLGVWYKNIFAREALMPAAAGMFLSIASMSSTMYMVRFAETKGIGNVGLFFTVYAITLVATRPISGRLIDQLGAVKIFLPSALIFACSFVIISFSNSLLMILAGAVVAAIGLGGSHPTIQTMCLQSVSPLRYGVASNTNFFGLDLGGFLGPSTAGIVISNFGLVRTLNFSGGQAVTFSPLYIAMIIPVLLSMLIFTIGLIISRRTQSP